MREAVPMVPAAPWPITTVFVRARVREAARVEVRSLDDADRTRSTSRVPARNIPVVVGAAAAPLPDEEEETPRAPARS
jgi:hypothetical protein